MLKVLDLVVVTSCTFGTLATLVVWTRFSLSFSQGVGQVEAIF